MRLHNYPGVLFFCLCLCSVLHAQQPTPCEELKEHYTNSYSPTLLRISLKYRDSVYEEGFGAIVLDDTSLNAGFSILLYPDPEWKAKFEGLLTYKLSGIHIYRESLDNFQQSTLLYADTNLKARFNENFSIPIPALATGPYFPGSSYFIRFDSILQIDCDGETWMVVDDFSLDDSYTVEFSCRIDEDPFFATWTEKADRDFLEESERVFLQLLHNGQNYEKTREIKEGDSLFVDLHLPKDMKVGNGHRFWVNRITIFERSCQGFVVSHKLPAADFPIAIPHAVLQKRWGGKFYISLGEVCHTDAQGRIFQIPLREKRGFLFLK